MFIGSLESKNVTSRTLLVAWTFSKSGIPLILLALWNQNITRLSHLWLFGIREWHTSYTFGSLELKTTIRSHAGRPQLCSAHQKRPSESRRTTARVTPGDHNCALPIKSDHQSHAGRPQESRRATIVVLGPLSNRQGCHAGAHGRRLEPGQYKG